MKTIRILPAVRHDLVDGFHFYEMQAEGIGRYFLDTLYSDKVPKIQFCNGRLLLP